jgi:hypothetical protein
MPRLVSCFPSRTDGFTDGLIDLALRIGLSNTRDRFAQLGHANIQNGMIYPLLTACTREQSARKLRRY